jgi:hypothetical protein
MGVLQGFPGRYPVGGALPIHGVDTMVASPLCTATPTETGTIPAPMSVTLFGIGSPIVADV